MERFPDDAMEPTSKVDMGLIYTKTTTGAPLRGPPTTAERGDMMDAYYWSHHERLHLTTTQALERAGTALILDLHSFPSAPLPTEASTVGIRLDICIGTDDFHTPPTLIDQFRNAFSQAGLRVAVNDRFSGTIVPSNFFRSDPRVNSIMIEVNRHIYLDGDETIKTLQFKPIRHSLQKYVARAIAIFTPSAVINR